MESLIATRPKMGYLLNLDRKEVLLFPQGGLPVISSLLMLLLDRCASDWPGWFLDMSERLFVW